MGLFLLFCLFACLSVLSCCLGWGGMGVCGVGCNVFFKMCLFVCYFCLFLLYFLGGGIGGFFSFVGGFVCLFFVFLLLLLLLLFLATLR